jgi:hypothetical protein
MTYLNITLSTTNPTWTGLGLNQDLHGMRLDSNQLSDCMDVDLSGISVMGISINLVSQYCNELPVITLPSVTGQNVAVENIESRKFSPLLQ